MMTPLNHLLPRRSQSGKSPRRNPNPLNTARPTLPFAMTPCASTTDKECLKTPTHLSTPQHRHLLKPPCLSEKMPPLPPNSSKSSTPDRPTTSQSHPLTHRFSMFPTPPLHLSKRSHHHPHSMYTLPLTASGTTLRSPLAWLRPSFAWRMAMTLMTLHTPLHTASSAQYIDAQQSPTKDSPKPTTVLTNSPEQCTPTKPRSAASGTGQGTSICPPTSNAMEDEWTFKCPPTMGRTSSPDGSKSWGTARLLQEQESTLTSQNTWSPSTSHQTTHSDPPPPYLSGSWSYSKPKEGPTTPWLKQPMASNTPPHMP